jgi:hypothetical protein
MTTGFIKLGLAVALFFAAASIAPLMSLPSVNAQDAQTADISVVGVHYEPLTSSSSSPSSSSYVPVVTLRSNVTRPNGHRRTVKEWRS